MLKLKMSKKDFYYEKMFRVLRLPLNWVIAVLLAFCAKRFISTFFEIPELSKVANLWFVSMSMAGVPVIILTVYFYKKYKKKYEEAGEDEYISVRIK